MYLILQDRQVMPRRAIFNFFFPLRKGLKRLISNVIKEVRDKSASGWGHCCLAEVSVICMLGEWREACNIS